MVATTGPDLLARHIRRLRSVPLAGLSDADLLRTFAEGGTEAAPAFELLVRRHGPMVLSTCRAAMGNHHAADDCFQAVFLVLIRKGRGLRLSGTLGPWLFEVARRVCSRARISAARRFRHEAQAARAKAAANANGLGHDMAATVHAEVGRLPRLLRSAVVLCDLAGLSYREAAERLGVSQATLRGRLARGRDRLRGRLEQQGLRPDGIWLAAAVVPAALAEATARAADVVAGRAAGIVSAAVTELVNGGLESMFMTKLKAAGLSAIASAVLVAGAMGLSAQATAPELQPGTDPSRPWPVAVSVLAGASNDADLGDDVGNLVRKAQRQQDRGDKAGARKTLAQAEKAMKHWATRLGEGDPESDATAPTPARRFGGTSRAPAAGALAPGTSSPAPGRPAPGLVGGMASDGPPAMMGTGFGGRRPADMESRVRELEAKLDRLLKQMQKAPSPSNKGPEELADAAT